jgi:multicomponent Na+:H+ antiporter subunit F
MHSLFVGASVALCLIILLSLYRAVAGPTVFDRIVGAGFIGTKTTVLLVLIGFIYGRLDMFVDLALVYSILNFIGTLVFSKYFINKGTRW